jgi:hypothetical protein
MADVSFLARSVTRLAGQGSGAPVRLLEPIWPIAWGNYPGHRITLERLHKSPAAGLLRRLTTLGAAPLTISGRRINSVFGRVARSCTGLSPCGVHERRVARLVSYAGNAGAPEDTRGWQAVAGELETSFWGCGPVCQAQRGSTRSGGSRRPTPPSRCQAQAPTTQVPQHLMIRGPSSC